MEFPRNGLEILLKGQEKMSKKLLVLGNTGKMGQAICTAFRGDYIIIGKNSGDFDAQNFEEVTAIVEAVRPDIVINAVAFLGIDSCERDSNKAFIVNTLYPKLLAELSNKLDFLLIHFSTDAVFKDRIEGAYKESDYLEPVNMYGRTKHGGDCLVWNIARRFYLIRISILFGESSRNTQFVEKMLDKIRQGATSVQIADDIISSPSYSRDIAKEIKRILEVPESYGVYHVANQGQVSLYELMNEIVHLLGLNVVVERASHKDFPCVGIKNTRTPIQSEKLKPLRHWKMAVADYCSRLQRTRTRR